MYMDHEIEAAVATIKPPPHFSIEAHRTCKMLMTQPNIRELVVDFREVQYIDSSVLGSLIYIRELFEKQAGSIKITNARGSVQEILQIAAFDKIFEMS